ncbi:Energy-coupling factor transporter ATP-binding protein EcfA 1 [Serratia marcescens]|uniref:Energy-coupling factor transporter ATP-binding protein EcfA 1 n=1 Tax=Serratia marcescens TaxID=615 RepID=A0A379ZT22_SERMA|nr:Energy-coupling factor transporter ATP-binding protein EcfA 1 [Serratia marcescens]
MGLVRPTAGRVSLSDKPVADALKKNLIAYVPQTEDVDWNFPVLVEDVVMMGRYGKMNFLRIPSREDRLRVDKALERVGLSELRGRQIGELSGGQKKRVFLARALAQQGTVLLLDEPFTGVDVKTENAIIELLRALRDEGHLILVSTHNLGSVPEFLRSGDPHQPHGAGRRPDRNHLHAEQPGAGVRRRAAPYQPLRSGSARRQRSAYRYGVDRR